MSSKLIGRLVRQLELRRGENKLREITVKYKSGQVDFSSNDYLGLSRNRSLLHAVEVACKQYADQQPLDMPVLGSTGSRLLTGHSVLFKDTEALLAAHHGHEHCLVANSGWDLNYGLLSCVPSEDTLIFYDDLSHNSLVVGARGGNGRGRGLSFKHNDMQHLEHQLVVADKAKAKDMEKIIVVETVYSMDGDVCPLRDVLELASKYHANVLVDEAHSTGVLGERGEGLVSSLGLQNHPNLLGVVYTFGKGMGLHGAALMTSHLPLLHTLANYCQPFVYSTSLPVPSLIALQQAYKTMATSVAERKHLRLLIEHFRSLCSSLALPAIDSNTPIQGIIVPTNERVMHVASLLQQQNFCCLAIRAPTVPSGSERIRIILHAHNSKQQVTDLCTAMAKFFR